MKSSFPDLVIPDVCLHDFVKSKIRDYGDDIALVDNDNGRSITFKELYDQINKLSFALARVGLKGGDIVGICSTNCIDYPIAYLAILSCGATAMAIPESLTREKLLQQLLNAKPRFLIVGMELEEAVKEVTKELSFIEEVFTMSKSSSSRSIEELIANESTQENFSFAEIDTQEDTAAIFHSSGTTGTPKGIIHTHKSLLSFIEIWRYHMKQFRSNCCYNYIPLHSCYGLLCLFTTLIDGSKCVIDCEFKHEKMLRAIEEYEVSHLVVGILAITALAKRQATRSYDTSSLRQITCTGTTISPFLMDQVEQRYKCIVSLTYGLTEIDPVTYNHPVTYNSASTGVITANTSLKVCDEVTGLEVKLGHLGSVLAKGPQMTKGYFKNPEKTEEVIDEDGWFHTGDIGYLDKNGMLYIMGRKKDLIKYKDNLISPAELENVLLQHPLILEAGVIGVPDEDAGELSRAYLVVEDQKLDVEQVIKFVEEKLPCEKHLHGGIEFLDKLPIPREGKIARAKLLELYLESKKNLN